MLERRVAVEPRLAARPLRMQWMTVRVLPGTMEMPPQAETVLNAGPTVLLPPVPPMIEALRTVYAMPVIMAAAAHVLP